MGRKMHLWMGTILSLNMSEPIERSMDHLSGFGLLPR